MQISASQSTWCLAMTAFTVAVSFGISCSSAPELPRSVPPLELSEIPGIAPPPAAGAATKRPNLLLISIDTLRADHVSAYGYDRETTPAIDRFAAEGVLFENAFSHAPRTAQSHMSLFTGLYPEEHRVKNFQDGDGGRLSENIPTLASILQGNGYVTQAFTGGGNIAGSLGFDLGFRGYEQSGARQFELAGEFLQRFTAGEYPENPNFFLFVHSFNTHDPYVSGDAHHLAQFADPDYSGDMIDRWEDLVALGGTDIGSIQSAFWSRVDKNDPDDMRRVIDLYDACIRSVDDSVGDLLDELDGGGLGEETIVVFLSDHGEEFREHGQFVHENVHRELLHVPLIIRFPHSDAIRGTRISAEVQLIDVMPTLLDALGSDVPRHVQGRSLGNAFAGRDAPPRAAYAQYEKLGFSVLRSGGWTLIRRPKSTPTGWKRWLGSASPVHELYATGDPGETIDVASAHPDLVAAMSAELDRVRLMMQENGGRTGSMVDAELDAETLRQLEALGYVGD